MGAGLSAAGVCGQSFKNFCNFLKNIPIVMPFRLHLEPFERTKLLRFETQLKKLNCLFFSLLTIHG